MGHGIAQCFGLAGWEATLQDPDPAMLASAPERISANLKTFVAAGLNTQEQADMCLDLVGTTPDLAEAVAGVEIVIESAPEKLDLKRQIFAELEELCPPETILATNTSAISIAEIAADQKRPEQVVGTHFWNPPHVIPCVEVVKTEATSDYVFNRTFEIMTEIGKEAVRVNKDLPGFVGNRMQHALQREAMSLVDNGVCTAEDVDRVVRYSFGLRLALMGPLERADLGGLDTTHRVQSYVLQFLEDRTDASPTLAALVEAGNLGAKAGKGFYDWPEDKLQARIAQRDRLLLELIKMVKEG